MLLVALDEVLLLAEYHANKFVVVLVHLLQICTVVVLHLGVVGHGGEVPNPFQQHEDGQVLIVRVRVEAVGLALQGSERDLQLRQSLRRNQLVEEVLRSVC